MPDDPKTIGEILQQLAALEMRGTVYKQVSAFLDRFISTDTFTPKEGIASPVKPYDTVPEETVQAVKDAVELTIVEIQAEVEKILGKNLPVNTAVIKKRRKINGPKKKNAAAKAKKSAHNKTAGGKASQRQIESDQ